MYENWRWFFAPGLLNEVESSKKLYWLANKIRRNHGLGAIYSLERADTINSIISHASDALEILDSIYITRDVLNNYFWRVKHKPIDPRCTKANLREECLYDWGVQRKNDANASYTNVFVQPNIYCNMPTNDGFQDALLPLFENLRV